jgi:16S rRNA U1498 N3-methylase RsmE
VVGQDTLVSLVVKVREPEDRQSAKELSVAFDTDMPGQIVCVHLLTTVILRASTAAVAARAAMRIRYCMLDMSL